MQIFTSEQRLIGGFVLGLAATVALSVFYHDGLLLPLIAAMGVVLIWITRREIVGRNRAETAHLVADSRLNVLLANAPFILYALNQDGIYTMLEGKGLEPVKLKPGQFVGQSIHDLYKDDPELLNTLKSALRGEISEGLLIRKGRTYHTSFFLSTDENGKRGELTAISGDITEHLHAQKSLDEQTYFLRSILDTDPSLVFVKDFDGRYSLANRAIADLYGTTVENLTGKTDADFLPDPGDPEQYCRDDREVIESQREKHIAEEFMTDLQGNLLWFETFKRPLLSPDGQCRHVLGICNNITDRKQAEDALREIQHRLNLVIGNAPLILFALNADGVFTLSKGRGLDALGLRPGEVVGLNALDFYAEHPQLIADLRAALAGETITNVIELDGKIFECRYVPVQDEQGRPAGIVGVNTDVTERQSSQQKIQNSLALLSATLESTEDGILVTGMNKQLLTVNKRFYELWRIDEAVWETQVEDERFGHIVNQVSDPEAFRARAAELYAKPEAESFDVISCLDGRLFERYSRPLIVEGTPTGRVWNFRDITRREQARQDLEQAKDQFQNALALLSATLESTEDGILVVGTDNKLLSANQRFYELWLIEESIRETQTEEERFHHVMSQVSDPEAFRARVVELYAQPEAEGFDVVSCLDGRLFERYSRPLIVEGTPTGRVWSFRDVTRREQARRDLEQAKDQSQNALALLSATLESTDDGVLVMGVNNKRLTTNQRFFEMWQIEEPLRETQTDEERLDHVMRQLADPEAFRARVAHLYASPEAESFDVLSFLDGRLFERYSRPLVVEGAAAGRVWSFRDVTQREQARRDLEQAKDQALASTKAKSDFLANMSHEIRTPMNGVLGMTTLLMNTSLDQKQSHFAQTIRHSADSLLAIINDILDFSKIEAGCMTLDTLAFDLHEVVAEVIALLVPRAQEKGLQLTSLLDLDFPSALLGDPGRLRQILTNLVGNAIKFTADGAVTVAVRLERQDAGRAEFRMEVRDKGVGIVPERLHEIFESFTQADGSITRKFGGTGLGLTICRQLVELMGGRIDVQSEIGVGSVFSVTLALEKSVAVEVGEDAPTLADLRVLLADADAESNRALAARLRVWGCRIEESLSAADALARLRDAAPGSDPFRLALLDRQLSFPDGDALAACIRREAALSALPLLLLSDEAVPGAALRPLGISACLTRPVRQSSLFDSLLTLFGPLPDDAPPALMPDAPATEIFDPDSLGLRVLLVEDNEINQEVALAFLEGWGCTANVAGNGRVALEMLAADDDYAVILMDLQMPEMGGIEATGEIRKRERETGRRLPIVAMTAHNMTGDRENCLENGMDDHVAKPIEPLDLRDALIRWGRRAPAPSSENKPMIQEQENFSDEPVMNWDRLHLSCGGKPALEKRVVSTFLKIAPDCLTRLGEAVQAVDAEQIRFEAHTLKGSSRTVGAEAVGAVCAELEQQAKSGTLDDASALFAYLGDEWTRLHLLLEAFIEETQAAA